MPSPTTPFGPSKCVGRKRALARFLESESARKERFIDSLFFFPFVSVISAHNPERCARSCGGLCVPLDCFGEFCGNYQATTSDCGLGEYDCRERKGGRGFKTQKRESAASSSLSILNFESGVSEIGGKKYIILLSFYKEGEKDY